MDRDTLRKEYPELTSLFMAYFHEDMDECYENTQDCLIDYVNGTHKEHIFQVLLEISQVYSKNYSDEKLEAIIIDLGARSWGCPSERILLPYQLLDKIYKIIEMELKEKLAEETQRKPNESEINYYKVYPKFGFFIGRVFNKKINNPQYNAHTQIEWYLNMLQDSNHRREFYNIKDEDFINLEHYVHKMLSEMKDLQSRGYSEKKLKRIVIGLGGSFWASSVTPRLPIYQWFDYIQDLVETELQKRIASENKNATGNFF